MLACFTYKPKFQQLVNFLFIFIKCIFYGFLTLRATLQKVLKQSVKVPNKDAMLNLPVGHLLLYVGRVSLQSALNCHNYENCKVLPNPVKTKNEAFVFCIFFFKKAREANYAYFLK